MPEKGMIRKIVDTVEKVIMGKTDAIYDILKCMLAGGHMLIEDVPGVGKTILAKALSKSLNLSYSRIQFTPDLLPSDITGVSIYNQKTGQFEFKKGPVFANIILADEINRTSPKTQSALLEVMEENQVSEGNVTYMMENPFAVLATQNPVEFEGTFRLPEAQLDRFMIKISLGYTVKECESRILQIYGKHNPLLDIEPVADGSDIIAMQREVMDVYASNDITDYIVDITSSTRNNKYLTLGASTRASISLLKIAKASAYIEGRDYVIPQDVKSNAVAVLSHRVCVSSSARAANIKSVSIIGDIVDRTHMPVVRVND